MTVNKVKLEIGIEKRTDIAHLTDIHLSLADSREPHLEKHALKRAEVFMKEADYPRKTPEEYFTEAMDYADKNCDIAVITGDVLDFVSKANLDASDRVLKNRDYMFTAGNHEFCPMVGIPDSQARKYDIYSEIQKHYKGNMFFESRIINGLNVITIDNSYYNYSALHIKALEEEIEKGLPIILFSHVPLTDSILNLQNAHKDLPPDKYMKEINLKMLDLISSCKLIKAEFTGHWHVKLENTFRDRIPEYVTAGCFKGEFTHIEIV